MEIDNNPGKQMPLPHVQLTPYHTPNLDPLTPIIERGFVDLGSHLTHLLVSEWPGSQIVAITVQEGSMRKKTGQVMEVRTIEDLDTPFASAPWYTMRK